MAVVRKEREEAERGSAQCQEYNSAPRLLGRRRPAACLGLRPDGPGGQGGGREPSARGRPPRLLVRPGREGGVRRRLGGRCEGGKRRKRAARGRLPPEPDSLGTLRGPCVAGKERSPQQRRR